MKRGFTPSQVIEGEVDYSLDEFLKDLWEEVKSKISKEVFNHLPEGEEKDRKYNEAIRKVFNFVYEICYMAVMEKQRLKLVLKQPDEGEIEIIKRTIKENKRNIDMLHAILTRRMAKGFNKGLTKKQAAKAVVEYSKELIHNWNKKEHLNKRLKIID